MARASALLQLTGVRLSLGGAPLFDGVDLSLVRGERACLVGANGAGKSTLLRILAGRLEADAGERALAKGMRLAVVAQEPDFGAAPDLLAYVTAPEDGQAGPEPHEAEAMLEAFDLDPARTPSGLSGGEARRAALARAFAARPDVILLDEPTNHLDIPAIEALEARLAAFRGATLIVSHDRRFLERVSTACFWLRHRRVLKSDKGFGAFEAWAEAVETEEERAAARLETHLKAEEHWLRRGVTARRSRNEGRRRKLEAMRAERRAQKQLTQRPSMELEAASGAQSGRLALEAKGLQKAWPGMAEPVVKGLDLRVLRGDRIGIVGPNGAGKTTLIDLLLLRIAPDAGTVRHGSNLEIAYIDQARALLRDDDTVKRALTPLGGDQVMVRDRPVHVAAYAKQFLFLPEQLHQPVAALSGGERNRLALAVTLARPANLLVLDEPTNDLDMETLDVLEEAVASYDGTVLVVSHDRAFLDAVTTQVLAAVGGGRWVETPGGFSDFEREFGGFAKRAAPESKAKASAQAALEPAAARRPHKLSYKDERRAAEIEAALPKLDADIAELERKLADPAFYASEGAVGFAAAAQRLEASRARKSAFEDEWLEIEARREG